MFLYKAYRQRYVNLLEEIENYILQKKDPFLKFINDACRILAGWKNIYGNNANKYTEANDGMAFTTTGKEGKNYNKKKEIA